MAIVLVMMQVSKRIDFENPDVLFTVRSMYVASNVLILAIYAYVRSVIYKKKGAFFLPFSPGTSSPSLPLSSILTPPNLPS